MNAIEDVGVVRICAHEQKPGHWVAWIEDSPYRGFGRDMWEAIDAVRSDMANVAIADLIVERAKDAAVRPN